MSKQFEESQKIADLVKSRAEELLGEVDPKKELDPKFVRVCLEANERGDGILFSALHKGNFLYNTTPQRGQWYRWNKHVWTIDEFVSCQKAVDDVAMEYLKIASQLQGKIDKEKIKKTDREKGWMYGLKDKYERNAGRLRNRKGAIAALDWARVVDDSMACKESDMDRHPWLLPVKNGVVNLKTGHLEEGRPDDLLTRQLEVDYDPNADMELWEKVVREISVDPEVEGSEEVPAFLKRTFGYAATGFSSEQYIWVFTGPGRNGKGVLFSMIAKVLGPYYHEINRGMILEQRNEPGPAAASEHLFSLLGKRIIVGAETNRGQKIDASRVKSLTGEDIITCRPNFRSEISFDPSHALFLHTNHIPFGLTRDFAMIQRLFKIEFPWMYVDDIETEKRRFPGQASRFRQKDPGLKKELEKIKPGILRWIVEGCREWQEIGLSPPSCITKSVTDLAKEEDYIGQFVKDCMEHDPDDKKLRIACTHMHNAFEWWWSENMDSREQRCPGMRAINQGLRERGFVLDKKGGKTWVYHMKVKFDVASDVDAFVARKGG